MNNKIIDEESLLKLKEYFENNKKSYNVHGSKESIDKVSSMKFENVKLNYIVTDDFPIDLDGKVYIIEDNSLIKVKYNY